MDVSVCVGGIGGVKASYMHLDEEEKKGKQEKMAGGEANLYRRCRTCTDHPLISALDESARLQFFNFTRKLATSQPWTD